MLSKMVLKVANVTVESLRKYVQIPSYKNVTGAVQFPKPNHQSFTFTLSKYALVVGVGAGPIALLVSRIPPTCTNVRH